MPQFLDTKDAGFDTQFSALLSAKREDAPDVDAAVAEIIEDVRVRGDEAVIDLTSRFDRIDLSPNTLAFSEAEIDAACAAVPEQERAALDLAADRIRAYHERQIPQRDREDPRPDHPEVRRLRPTGRVAGVGDHR